VIKIESVHIEEMRGIRKLDLDLARKTYAISGPNGSGKSGVIDAIEFGLTGQIGRLTGRGTQGLTVSEHGPHVDKTKFPDAAFVTLRVFLTGIGKTATITRKVASPKKPTIEPADEEVKAVLAEVADHPEVTLSRREILRFILVEPTKRSEEIQAILKLEQIGQTRSVLNTAQNRLQTAFRTATAQVEAARNALMLHLQIATMKAADLLEAVNKRRSLLGLSAITELTADTRLDAGLSDALKASDFNKESALRDLKALAESAKGFPDLGKAEAAAITADLASLDADPALLAALKRRSFIEKGLELLDGPECPLCDKAWETEEHLREHLKSKLAKSEQARKLQESLLSNGAALLEKAVGVTGLITSVQKLAESRKDAAFAKLLSAWKTDIDGLQSKLASVDGIREHKARLASGWLAVPRQFSKSLKSLSESIEAQPDQTATLDAQTFLTTAQTRLSDYRETMRKNKAAETAVKSANEAYRIYCDVLEEELNALYDEVEKDFSTFYRAINGNDESTFTAKLTPTEGSLDLMSISTNEGCFRQPHITARATRTAWASASISR
jgi:DNA repair exonuclease SbcCD ATPase subunit